MHDSWVDQARLPENSDEPVLPLINDPSPPFWVVGHNHWDMRTVNIEGNQCLSCHRISMELIESFALNGWEINEHMPPEDPSSLTEDYQELLDCWTNGPENTPGCDWIIPPAGDCEGGVVHDDYPYKLDLEQHPEQ